MGEDTVKLTVLGEADARELLARQGEMPVVQGEAERVASGPQADLKALAERLARRASAVAGQGITLGCEKDVWMGLVLAVIAEDIAAVVDAAGGG